jgi:hypothetical protein
MDERKEGKKEREKERKTKERKKEKICAVVSNSVVYIICMTGN